MSITVRGKTEDQVRSRVRLRLAQSLFIKRSSFPSASGVSKIQVRCARGVPRLAGRSIARLRVVTRLELKPRD
jgi:hypothetical protein